MSTKYFTFNCTKSLFKNLLRSFEDPLVKDHLSVLSEMEKEMATHSSILAWKIPWMEEGGRSMGSQRVGCDFAFTFCLR